MISERAVHESLQETSKKRTTLIVAHRPSAIRHADHIIFLDQGRVVAEGTHLELLSAKDTKYDQLFGADELPNADLLPTLPTSLAADQGKTVAAKPVGEAGTLFQISSSDESKIKDQSVQSLTLDSSNSEHNSENLAEGSRKNASNAIKFIVKLSPKSTMIWAFGLMGCVGAGLTYPAFAIVYGQAYSTFATDRQDGNEQNLNALWFFVIAVLGSLCILVQFGCLALASARFSAETRFQLFASLLRKPISFFDLDNNTSGALSKIISSSPDAIEKVIGVTMGSFISSGITLGGGAVVALVYNWKFALVNLSVVPLTLLTGLCRMKIVDAKEGRIRTAHMPSVSLATEAVNNFRTVASLSREPYLCSKFDAMLDKTQAYVLRLALLDTAAFALAQSNMFFVIALGFWYGGKLLSRGELSQREFFVVFIAIISGSFQCVNLLAQSPEISQAKSAFAQIQEIIDNEQSDRPNPTRSKKALSSDDQAPKSLVSDRVHFHYPSRSKTVLDGLSFRADAGRHIALCGPSGSGKSTAIALIERFYDPNSGTVAMDAQNIADIDLTSYRSRVSLVTQEPILFSGSIEDNLLLGAPDNIRTSASPEKVTLAIEQALQEANMLTVVQELPDGLKTDLGAKGITLSGGQRQRLVLARAILKQPSLLLLDEATSSLDHVNQSVVQRALDTATASGNRTTISVVHRLETLKDVDRIFVIDQGHVAEQGTFSALKDGEGLFAEMLRSGARMARSMEDL